MNLNVSHSLWKEAALESGDLAADISISVTRRQQGEQAVAGRVSSFSILWALRGHLTSTGGFNQSIIMNPSPYFLLRSENLIGSKINHCLLDSAKLFL